MVAGQNTKHSTTNDLTEVQPATLQPDTFCHCLVGRIK